ncbi:hypothetical protein ACH3XW_34885 [Acanthocheilonema viteae]
MEKKDICNNPILKRKETSRKEDTRGQNCPSKTEGKGQKIPQFFPLAQVWFTILRLPARTLMEGKRTR